MRATHDPYVRQQLTVVETPLHSSWFLQRLDSSGVQPLVLSLLEVHIFESFQNAYQYMSLVERVHWVTGTAAYASIVEGAWMSIPTRWRHQD